MEKQFERDLINYLYFDLNRFRYFVQDEIFEYDIQSCIHQFLKIKYKNSNIKIKREKYKSDHVIEFLNDKGDIIFTTLLEVKSFIKTHESLSFIKILKDVDSLYKDISLDIFGYFILVVKESHLNNKSKKLTSLIKSLNGTNKIHYFDSGSKKIKTRIIRSFKTIYTNKENVNQVHKSQIRIFMFQIL